MQATLFSINSSVSLTIGNLLQSDLFECTSVSAKDNTVRPTADSKISDFQSVQFGVKGKSSLGFRLSHVDEEYQLSVPNLATVTDWTGALMFLKSLLIILDVQECSSEGTSYDIETVLTYRFQQKFLVALSELINEIKINSIVKLMGIRRSIFLDENYIGQIIHVSEDQLLDSYDRRLMLTQNIVAYFSEQQVFKIEQSGEDIIVPVNYINSERLTVLPIKPELQPHYQQQYQGKKIAVARLFIMTSDGEKLAEVPYEKFLESLTEGLFMLDAKYVAVEPFKLD